MLLLLLLSYRSSIYVEWTMPSNVVYYCPGRNGQDPIPTLGLVVVSRPTTTDKDDGASSFFRKANEGIIIVNVGDDSSSSPSCHASSTAIREAICEAPNQPIPHLDASVEKYLRRRHGKQTDWWHHLRSPAGSARVNAQDADDDLRELAA
jgi:hypothetical protein